MRPKRARSPLAGPASPGPSRSMKHSASGGSMGSGSASTTCPTRFGSHRAEQTRSGVPSTSRRWKSSSPRGECSRPACSPTPIAQITDRASIPTSRRPLQPSLRRNWRFSKDLLPRGSSSTEHHRAIAEPSSAGSQAPGSPTLGPVVYRASSNPAQPESACSHSVPAAA